MHRLSIFIIQVLCLLIVSLSVSYASTDEIKTVVIDAGHGGKDPGALGKNSREKDIALSVALKTGNYIKQNFPDVAVYYTRDRDVFIPLNDRAKIANQHKADLFISIHCNAIGSKNAWGAETFVMGLHKSEQNLAVAKTENAALLLEANHTEEYEGFNPNSDEDYITLTMFQSAYLEQSTTLAQKIQDQFRERVGRSDRGVKQAGFWVLYKTSMPGVLVELGFLSNPKEEKFLLSEKGQSYMASAIYRAFKDYKKNYENLNKTENPAPLSQENKTDAQENKPEASESDQTKKPASKETDKAAKTDTEAAKNDICFKVQFASSAKKKEVTHFKKMEYSISSYIDNKRYKYVSGNFSRIEDAINYKNKLRKKGYEDAFVVSFLDGKRIPTKTALEMLKKKN